MTQSGDTGLAQAQAAVSGLVEAVFASLHTIAAATTALWDRLEREGSRPRSGDLVSLRPVVIGELQRHGTLMNGAGVVVADGALADCERFLEWWRPAPGSDDGAQRLSLDLNPRSEYFYDYTTMEWYLVPRDQVTSCVYGPYLDFTGVDIYVCTFSVPVVSGSGKFVGVAATDIPVARIDAMLWPTFTAARRPLALANAEGRVIVANHADHVTGSKIRGGADGSPWPVPQTPWALVPLTPS